MLNDRMKIMMEWANKAVMRNPNLKIIPPEIRESYPALHRMMEDLFINEDNRNRLLLPNLTAENNESVMIFSDYGGEHGSKYQTYSFLICAQGALAPFEEKAIPTYRDKLGAREIAFKNFSTADMRHALPKYLRAMNDYVPGLLFTLVVESDVQCLFAENSKAGLKSLPEKIQATGYPKRPAKVCEKMLRIIHTIIFLIALLVDPKQKIFWMTDNDSICSNNDQLETLLSAFKATLGTLYPQFKETFVGGAIPFPETHLPTLDWLSVTDIAAGSIDQYFSNKTTDAQGNLVSSVKPGADTVIEWMCDQGISLKKISMMVRADGLGYKSGSIDMNRLNPNTSDEIIFIDPKKVIF